MTAPRRRWFAFSLRTLFAMLTLFGATLGWIVWQFEKAKERRTVLTQYLRAGAGFSDTARGRRAPPFSRLLGDVGPIPDIELPSDKFTDAQRRRLQSIIPEVPVTIVDRPPRNPILASQVDWAESHPYLWSD